MGIPGATRAVVPQQLARPDTKDRNSAHPESGRNAPIFALAQRQCASWRYRLLALAAVLLVFALGSFALLHLLPIGPAASLPHFS